MSALAPVDSSKPDSVRWTDPSSDAFPRIRKYLDDEFFRANLPTGTRIPPVRTVAHQLGVSTTAVHAVYQQLQEQGLLISAVGRGTFLSPQAHRGGNRSRKICLALAASIRESNSSPNWSNSIIQNILRAATRDGRRVSILPFDESVGGSDEASRILIDEVNEVDGLVLFPASMKESDDREVVAAYDKLKKPIIRINPPAINATKNFVSPDYFQSGMEVGRVFLKEGRKSIVFLTHYPMKNLISAQLRLAGLNTALIDKDQVSGWGARVVSASDMTSENGRAAMGTVLAEGGNPPDAIFAFGDLLAMGACEACEAAGLRIPDDVSIVGGTGLAGAHDRDISTTPHPFDEIGEQIVHMALASVQSGGVAQPGCFLPLGFHAGQTTLPRNI